MDVSRYKHVYTYGWLYDMSYMFVDVHHRYVDVHIDIGLYGYIYGCMDIWQVYIHIDVHICS